MPKMSKNLPFFRPSQRNDFSSSIQIISETISPIVANEHSTNKCTANPQQTNKSAASQQPTNQNTANRKSPSHCLSDFLSESRIASVNQWIVSSPFRSETRASGIRLEDVLSSPEILEKSGLPSQVINESEATSKRLSEKVFVCLKTC